MFISGWPAKKPRPDLVRRIRIVQRTSRIPSTRLQLAAQANHCAPITISKPGVMIFHSFIGGIAVGYFPSTAPES